MRIDIRKCDDWIAVYKDGAIVVDRHSCSLERGLEALEIPFTSVELPVDDLGRLPGGEDPFPKRLEPIYADSEEPYEYI